MILKLDTTEYDRLKTLWSLEEVTLSNGLTGCLYQGFFLTTGELFRFSDSTRGL